MRKPRGFKLRHYEECFIDLNDYLALFPGATFSEKMAQPSMLNSMSNSWFKQSYVQGFYYEAILF